jgi:hypothetical protein
MKQVQQIYFVGVSGWVEQKSVFTFALEKALATCSGEAYSEAAAASKNSLEKLCEESGKFATGLATTGVDIGTRSPAKAARNIGALPASIQLRFPLVTLSVG